jgi:hypothetical protein
MDASPLFDPQYLPIIVATLVGFSALALVLLVPIYRFLDREQEVSEEWTPEELAKRRREQQATENSTSGAADTEAEAKSKDAPG